MLIKRQHLAVSFAVLLAACTDAGGPVAPPLSPTANQNVVAQSAGELCAGISPCDGRLNGGTPGFYFLPSLTANPGDTGEFFPGALPFLVAEVAPHNVAACEVSSPPTWCAVETLGLEEATDKYQVTNGGWKNPKGGPKSRPTGTTWRISVVLDGTLMGFRDVLLTDSPNQTQPADGATLDIRDGSNQGISFTLAKDAGGFCLGGATAPSQVECLVDFDDGGVLTVETGAGAVVLSLGSGNGLGVRNVSGKLCSLSGGNTEIDTDLVTLGTCTTWEADPPLNGAVLTGSAIYVCEFLIDNGLDLGGFAVHMQDGIGTEVLSPIDAVGPCPALTGGQYEARVQPPNGFKAFFASLAVKSGLYPRALLASTTSAVFHGSAGGSLRTLGSDFQLALATAMTNSTPLTQTVPINGTTTIEVALSDDSGIAVSGADVYFYSDANGSLSCPSGQTCSTPGGVPVPAGGSALVVTSIGGLASVELTVGSQTAKVWALGCGIAVPGSDTPATASLPGPCDRDPADTESSTSFANGPAAGLDPFISDPSGSGSALVYFNDLPIEFTSKVCGSPTVDGVLGLTEWEAGCAKTTTFQVDVGNATETATLYWFNDATDLYLAVKLPNDSGSDNTTIAFEFDAGNGTLGTAAGQADENDELLVLAREKVKGSLTQTFTDSYLKSNCTTGTSFCNSVDSDVAGSAEQGSAAVEHNPADASGRQFLFYELTHPLCTGEAQDFCLSAGDLVGMYIRIGIGNSKSSQNMWPGLRVYANPSAGEPGPPIVIR